jgi:hypothetical protein
MFVFYPFVDVSAGGARAEVGDGRGVFGIREPEGIPFQKSILVVVTL